MLLMTPVIVPGHPVLQLILKVPTVIRVPLTLLVPQTLCTVVAVFGRVDPGSVVSIPVRPRN